MKISLEWKLTLLFFSGIVASDLSSMWLKTEVSFNFWFWLVVWFLNMLCASMLLRDISDMFYEKGKI